MAAPAAIFRHAARTVLLSLGAADGRVLPRAHAFGLTAAIFVALAWYYGGVAVRLMRRRPVVGAMLLGAGLMTIRAAVAIWTGSAFVFFLQPVAGTIATATSFALTALAGRPLAERLAHDFVPVPPELSHRLRANQFFNYTSLMWALVYGINAAGTVWLLVSSSLELVHADEDAALAAADRRRHRGDLPRAAPHAAPRRRAPALGLSRCRLDRPARRARDGCRPRTAAAPAS